MIETLLALLPALLVGLEAMRIPDREPGRPSPRKRPHGKAVPIKA